MNTGTRLSSTSGCRLTWLRRADNLVHAARKSVGDIIPRRSSSFGSCQNVRYTRHPDGMLFIQDSSAWSWTPEATAAGEVLNDTWVALFSDAPSRVGLQVAGSIPA